MALQVSRGDGPRGYGSSPIGHWAGGEDPRLGQFEQALHLSGVDIKKLLEALRGKSEVLIALRQQLDGLMDRGASKEEIAAFFRAQAQASQAFADTAKGQRWKENLARLRNQLPQAN